MSSRAVTDGPIRVVVVDDRLLFRDGLRTLLEEQSFDIVGCAPSGEAGVELALELQPDVVIMDLQMPGISGVEATRRLMEGAFSGRVLVLTVSAADSDVLDAMLAGASGYLLKDAAPLQLGTAVRATAAGEATLTPSVAARLVEHARRASASAVPQVDLSERELEVLRLIAEGKDNAEIAERLVISRMTAKNHVSRILSKIGVENRVQAAIYAVRADIL